MYSQTEWFDVLTLNSTLRHRSESISSLLSKHKRPQQLISRRKKAKQYETRSRTIYTPKLFHWRIEGSCGLIKEVVAPNT